MLRPGEIVGVKAEEVGNFQTIALTSALSWSDGATVLTATPFDDGTAVKAKLDVSSANFSSAAKGEKMTLLASGTDNNIKALSLKYNGGTADLSESKLNQVVKEGTVTPDSGTNGVTINTSKNAHIVSLDAANSFKNVTYRVADYVQGVSFGEMTWGTGRDASGTDFTDVTDANIDTSGLTFKDPGKIAANGTMKLVENATNLATGTDREHSQSINQNATNGVTITGSLNGTVTRTTAGEIGYKATGTTLTVNLAGWDGNEDNTTLSGWAKPASATVETDSMNVSGINPGDKKTILTADTADFFKDAVIKGAKQWKESGALNETVKGVTLTGTTTGGGVKADDANQGKLIYQEVKNNVNSMDVGTVAWETGATLFDGSDAAYDYASVNVIDTGSFTITNPEAVEVESDASMTLLKANKTLQNMAAETKQASYSYTPVAGVTVEGNITGTLKSSGGAVTYTPTANQASKLTFGSVEWKDSGALMTRPANVVFDGAKVVTTNIKFTNIDSQVADQTMTLVHKFDGTPSAIEGDHYMVGSGRMGEGAAEMNGNDLIFRTKTGTAPTEATHETVMAMEAGTAVVAAGREYVDSAVEGLGLISNMAPDGTSTFASMGGGVGRYKTGSHVDTHTWSAVVAVGSKREHKKGSLEWGVFAEYGRGNYTLHDDNGGRGDGDTHYAGGGLLAKWTNKHDVYAEASVRMGRMSDSASNMLTDRLGNSYGYDVHANYVGGHVGFGKIYKVQKTKDLDVYGKFFYTRRNGVDFDAGGNHYSLDSVNSSLLRVGARYGSNDRKWNWYGGLAYEYEFGGESKGTVDGLAIRSASIKGASVRGEIGMRMEATKTNPWKVDIGIFGYGGKHRGFGGSVNVAYMF